MTKKKSMGGVSRAVSRVEKQVYFSEMVWSAL